MLYICILLVLLYCQGLEQCRTDNHDKISMSALYYEQGMSYAETGKYMKAVSFLRSACRIRNDSALYWNDLGVTEMRLGLYQKAKIRFMKALHIDNTFAMADENLRSIQSYLSKEEFQSDRRYRQQHSLKHVPTTSIQSLYHANISNDSVLGKPFYIPNAVSLLGWNLSTFTVEQLIQRFGNQSVDYYPQNMKEETVSPYFTTLSDGINQLLTFPSSVYDDVDISEPGTYIQWNLNFKNWATLMNLLNASLPDILTDRHWLYDCHETMKDIDEYLLKTHWKMLIIGQESSGMFNHQDTLKTSSWQIQIVGRKRWHLCGPSENKRMYRPGDIDAFNPDYGRFPRFRAVRDCHDIVLSPGDMIYYPTDYWHQTLNLETPTVSITGTIISSQNHELVHSALLQECKGRGTIFSPGREFCDRIEKCFLVWQNLYKTQVS